MTGIFWTHYRGTCNGRDIALTYRANYSDPDWVLTLDGVVVGHFRGNNVMHEVMTVLPALCERYPRAEREHTVYSADPHHLPGIVEFIASRNQQEES